MNYPYQVARLQELETHISGGCTAVVAIITQKRLYVANVGDSRAVLAYETRDKPALQVRQLSEDHSVENEQERQRLAELGLDPEQLLRTGRLGTQENTRSIGDYSIKGGYRDVDIIRYDMGSLMHMYLKYPCSKSAMLSVFKLRCCSHSWISKLYSMRFCHKILYDINLAN